MPALKNPRHERFAQELAKGKTADEAYQWAGYAPSRKNAHRLRTNEGVARRLSELQERAAIRAEVTATDIAIQLDEDRKLAHSAKQAGAAVSASLAKARVLGIMSAMRIEHTGANGGPIKYDLSTLSDAQLHQLHDILVSAKAPGWDIQDDTRPADTLRRSH